MSAGDGAQQRRLAGAVGADDGERLAGIETDVDAEQRLEVAVEGRQAVGFEQAPSDLDAEIDLAHLRATP